MVSCFGVFPVFFICQQWDPERFFCVFPPPSPLLLWFCTPYLSLRPRLLPLQDRIEADMQTNPCWPLQRLHLSLLQLARSAIYFDLTMLQFGLHSVALASAYYHAMPWFNLFCYQVN